MFALCLMLYYIVYNMYTHLCIDIEETYPDIGLKSQWNLNVFVSWCMLTLVPVFQVPSCLVLQMPRFGKEYKMYSRIVPSLTIDITGILEDGMYKQHFVLIYMHWGKKTLFTRKPPCEPPLKMSYFQVITTCQPLVLMTWHFDYRTSEIGHI